MPTGKRKKKRTLRQRAIALLKEKDQPQEDARRGVKGASKGDVDVAEEDAEEEEEEDEEGEGDEGAEGNEGGGEEEEEDGFVYKHKRPLMIFAAALAVFIVAIGLLSSTTADSTIVVAAIRKKNNERNASGWGQWGEWGPCSVTCGGGEQERIRACETEDCRGKTNGSQSCGEEACPVDYDGTGAMGNSSDNATLTSRCPTPPREPIPAFHFLFSGYTLQAGLPFHGPSDPGFVKRIFASNLEPPAAVFTQDCSYLLPQGVTQGDSKPCEVKVKAYLAQNESELRTVFQNVAHVSGNSSDAGPKSDIFAQNILSLNDSMLMYTVARCDVYTLSLADPPPPLLLNFVNDTNALVGINGSFGNVSKDTFVTTYGTHFPTLVKVGLVHGAMFQVPRSNFTALNKTASQLADSAKNLFMSYLNMSAADQGNSTSPELVSLLKSSENSTFGLKMAEFINARNKLSANSSIDVSTKDMLKPVEYHLQPLHQLFTDKYFQANLGTNINQTTLSAVSQQAKTWSFS